jgi:hypothetical protein
MGCWHQHDVSIPSVVRQPRRREPGAAMWWAAIGLPPQPQIAGSARGRPSRLDTRQLPVGHLSPSRGSCGRAREKPRPPTERTGGACGAVRLGLVHWPALVRTRAARISCLLRCFSDPEPDSCPVQAPKDRFSPGSFFHRLQCRTEHCSRPPTARGRSVWPQERGGGPIVLQVPPPINRSHPPHFKIRKREAEIKAKLYQN